MKYLLDVYVSDFCHPKVPNYIIKHMNNGLLQTSWKDYKVRVDDVVNMHRLMNFMNYNYKHLYLLFFVVIL